MSSTIRATRPVLSCALNLAPTGLLFEALARHGLATWIVWSPLASQEKGAL